MEDIEQEILDEFIIEASELLENAEGDIIEIETATNKELVNRIFRAFHTVKGNAAMIGLENLATLAHHAEDTLSKVRNDTLKPNKTMVDLLLKVIDSLKQLLRDAGDKIETSLDITSLINELERIDSSEKPEPSKTIQATSQPNVTTFIKPSPPKPGALNILVVEDDFTSRKLLKLMLSKYGQVDIAVNGEEAIQAVGLSLEGDNPEAYHLICMDIMMPELDGLEAVKRIRDAEREKGLSPRSESIIIMTTALGDPKTVIKSLYKCGATSYMVKPIERKPLENELKKHGLI